MEIFIKVAPKEYQQLRSQIPSDSAAREAIDKATPIEGALDGVLFEGYNIPCNERQAHIIREIAMQYFPDITRSVDNAIMLARDKTSGL
jgi:hypothetical protein